jgi:microcompartment protein CcmL/EutN
MAETKTHPVYGEVIVLQSSGALVQVETENGDSFWITVASFIDKKKKATKRRAKKKKVVHKLDEPVDALLVRETRAEEAEPEVFDEVENVVREDAEEETEESCEEPITSGEDMAA